MFALMIVTGVVATVGIYKGIRHYSALCDIEDLTKILKSNGAMFDEWNGDDPLGRLRYLEIAHRTESAITYSMKGDIWPKVSKYRKEYLRIIEDIAGAPWGDAWSNECSWYLQWLLTRAQYSIDHGLPYDEVSLRENLFEKGSCMEGYDCAVELYRLVMKAVMAIDDSDGKVNN